MAPDGASLALAAAALDGVGMALAEGAAALDLSPRVVAVVLGMAAVTYATKAGGLWAMGRVDVPPRATAALEALPGSIVVAILAVELAEGGPPEWAAAGLVAVVASRTDNVLLALAAGVVAVVLLRGA